MKSLRRRLANILVRACGTVLPPDRLPWAAAMNAELQAIQDSDALTFASGCVWASVKGRAMKMRSASQVSNLKLGLLLGLLLSVAIVATNVIWPSIVGHPSSDNVLSESIGWFVIAALVTSAGYLKVRTIPTLREAALAGGAITFIGFGMAMLTFLAIDNLFLGIVSQEPEKIWLFHRSGFPTMRSYLNHANLRALWTALPVITVIGAMSGMAGGYIGQLRRPRAD